MSDKDDNDNGVSAGPESSRVRSDSDRHPPKKGEPLSTSLVQELKAALHVAIPVENADTIQGRRDRLLTVIEREVVQLPALRKREDQRYRWNQSFRVIAAAAVLVGALGLGSWLTSADERQASVVVKNRDSSTQAALRIENPGSGTWIHSSDKRVEFLELPGHTELRVRPRSRLLVVNDAITNQILRLQEGGVRVSVPPSGSSSDAPFPQRSVSILTPHARVEVKGTIFSVNLLNDKSKAEHRSHVEVERGVVLVRHSSGVVILRAGDSWLSEPTKVVLADEPRASAEYPEFGLPAPSSKANTKAPKSLFLAEHPSTAKKLVPPAKKRPQAASISSEQRPATPGAPNRRLGSSPAPKNSAAIRSSTLAEQNALLEAALLAADGGNNSRALELTSELLGKYPDSPLGASARSVRRRVQAASGH